MTALRETLELPGSVASVVGALPTTTDPGSTPKVLGLDLSLSGTGVAGDGWADTIKPPAKLRGVERMAHIRGILLDRYVAGVDLVVVEGPSYGNQGTGRQAGHHERAGLWWIMRYALHLRDIPVAVVAPASLKLYAAGKGNAGKDDVLREATRRFDWFAGDNNAADALWLAAVGADWLGSPMVAMPAVNRKALAKCDWSGVDMCGVAA